MTTSRPRQCRLSPGEIQLVWRVRDFELEICLGFGFWDLDMAISPRLISLNFGSQTVGLAEFRVQPHGGLVLLDYR